VGGPPPGSRRKLTMGMKAYSKFDNHQNVVKPDDVLTYVDWDGNRTSYEYSYPTQPTVSWLSGFKLDNYKQAIANHNPATTPLEAERDKLVQSPGYTTQQIVMKPGYSQVGNEFTESKTYIRDYNWYVPDWLSVWSTEADNEALRRFVNQVRTAQTTFQGGTFAAELGKAIAQIKNPAKSLRSHLGHKLKLLQTKQVPSYVKNLKRVKAREAIADTWLEIQFGARPLINDLDNAIQAVAESGVMTDNQYVNCVGVGTKESIAHSGPFIHAPGGVGVSYMKQVHAKVFIRYLGQVDAGLYAMTNMRRMGVDPSNWLPTAWEIVPYSFLIDYFSNVGDIISAATLAKSGLLWVNKTEVRSYEWSMYNYRPYGCDGSYPHAWSSCAAFVPPKFSHLRKKVYRTDYTNSSLVPNLEFSMPGTGTKWLNIAALVSGRSTMRKQLRI
jgi:hypothetical protein